MHNNNNKRKLVVKAQKRCVIIKTQQQTDGFREDGRLSRDFQRVDRFVVVVFDMIPHPPPKFFSDDV